VIPSEKFGLGSLQQAELSETLKRVDENLQIMNKNQSKLNELLMQVTHQGKNPDTYGNKEVGGSNGAHEEIRYNPEKGPVIAQFVF
jgi:hypothetical protein